MSTQKKVTDKEKIEALVEALEYAKSMLEREYNVDDGEGVGGPFKKINEALKLAEEK